MTLPIAEHLEKSFKGKKAAPFKAGGGRDEEHENDAKGRKRKRDEKVEKKEVHVGEYTRIDPRSGKVVHVSSYDRSIVAQLTRELEKLSAANPKEGGYAKVKLPNGLGEIRKLSSDHEWHDGPLYEGQRMNKGGYSGVNAKGHGVGTYKTAAEAVEAIAHSNGGGEFGHATGRKFGGGKLHPDETVTPEKKKGLRGLFKKALEEEIEKAAKRKSGPEPANEKTKREEEEDGEEAEPGKEDSQQEEEADEAQGGRKKRQKVRDEVEKRIEKAVVRVPGYTRHDGTHVDGYAYETTDGPSGLAGRIRERLSASGRHNRAVRQMTNDVARRRAAEYRRPQVRADYNRLRRKHLDGTISAKEKAQMYALKRELTGRDPQRPQQETGKIDVGRNPMMSVPAPTDHALPGQHGPGPKRLDKSPVGDPYATPEENAREAARIAFEDWAREKLDAEEIAGVG